MDSAAYQKASQSRGDIVWIRCSKKDSSLYVVNKSDKIIAGRILYDMGKTRKIGFLAIGTDLSDYETVCRNMLQYDNEGMMLPSILILILLLFSWPLSRLVSHSLSRPMKELRDAMRRFRKGDFGLQLPVTGNDEIGQISQSFNKMARETKQLIEKNYVMALREKESELNTLQADRIYQHQPDVMLLDVQMPIKNGIEVMREARAANVCPKTILLSGYDNFEYVSEALR